MGMALRESLFSEMKDMFFAHRNNPEGKYGNVGGGVLRPVLLRVLLNF